MIDKVIRIFISSTQCLLIEDRQTIINTILQHGAFPIAQEYDFQASNAVMPVSKCEEKVDMADAIILVINAWYGSIVQENGQKKKCAGCKVKDKCPHCGEECQISYTHYEYLYANYIGKGNNIYVLKRDGVNSTRINDQTFVDERNRCQKECARLRKACSNCQQSIVDIPTAFYSWIEKIEARMRSIYRDEKSLIEETGKITERIKDECGRESSPEGLYPYDLFLELKKTAEIYSEIQINVAEQVFKNQAAAIEDARALYQTGELYNKSEDDRPLIRVLCFRGNSFVNNAGADWEEIIFTPDTKGKSIEFILANLESEEILKRRWSAYTRFNTYEDFKKQYKGKMASIENILLNPNDEYNCQLFLHDDVYLPFRMFFVGDILYLSFFFNNLKATDSPVYKLHKGSSLYRVCEEYYNRVKKRSVEKKEM